MPYKKDEVHPSQRNALGEADTESAETKGYLNKLVGFGRFGDVFYFVWLLAFF